MPHLEVEGRVAEHLAGLHTLGTANAAVFNDVVFPVGILDENALDRIGGAELVLRRRGQFRGVGLKISEAQLAIPADGIGLDTLHRRGLHHAGRRTMLALDALHRIDLPDGVTAPGAKSGPTPDHTQGYSHKHPHALPQKRKPGNFFGWFF